MEFKKIYEGQDDYFICKMSSQDVSHMEKELAVYMNKKGEIYQRSIFKNPSFENFFYLYFQVEDGDCYTTPALFECTNYKVRDRLLTYLSKLEYHDTNRQTYCLVGREEKRSIKIVRGDY